MNILIKKSWHKRKKRAVFWVALAKRICLWLGKFA